MRPIVESPRTHEIRVGRGFSLGELKKAGVTLREAKKSLFPIDHRRRSVREENVKRLIEEKEIKLKEIEEAKVEEEKHEGTSLDELSAVSKRVYSKLTEAGIETVEELSKLSPKILTETVGISEPTAKKIISAAKTYLKRKV